MMRLSQKAFHSAVVMSSIRVRGPLPFGYNETKSESLRFGRDNIFYLAAVNSPIRPQ